MNKTEPWSEKNFQELLNLGTRDSIWIVDGGLVETLDYERPSCEREEFTLGVAETPGLESRNPEAHLDPGGVDDRIFTVGADDYAETWYGWRGLRSRLVRVLPFWACDSSKRCMKPKLKGDEGRFTSS
ncbi:hypothetical protein SBOR_4679 [Sclerotinia borealis F-4128]|uniref:Uncharacterized protein n=1 Tax=Sclerotinia borealis (strain F-4128) TaxID=1432307 RepID=W9CKA5_SCLBF|nr:hypothetical protein SBOR_4679 [Sclerotinia borealis F-4128]